MSRALEERITDTQASNHRMIAVNHRVGVGLGLTSVAALHILDLPGNFAETPYRAALYIALIIASFVLTQQLVIAGTRRDFFAAAALSAAVIVGFTINRTVGMPGAANDIGNWLERLGLLSIAVVAFVPWQSIAAVVGMPRKAR